LKLNELFFLIGKWSGSGAAEYPSISKTGYTEQLVFEYDNTKDLIFYVQRTKFADPSRSGDTLHFESGFIKETDDGNIEISNSQNNGRVEVLTLNKITNDAGIIKVLFRSKLFGNDPRMISTSREYILDNNILKYEMKMATIKNNELNTHLKAELKRES
jgi:hypothetical protein